ncbi:MAG: glycoside hydrolase family 38 C-terminal domain-containing protein [Bacteroidales bacterium]
MPLTLVCNSHIDPVWLWRWEEGLAETLATFRAAATLCEEFEDFVFCHNEALLYQWTETYEPGLFARIRELVRRGRWHVMGGWYLQPDCNLPSGESFVRQVLVGKRYFMETFGVEPKVAVNLDPFGHGRGLVQILRKAGYDGYLFCRPDRSVLQLPADDFTWVGYDGSTVLAHRAADHYNSELGKARAKVERWLERHPESEDGLLLWGVGNHGGGPSRLDLRDLASLMAERPQPAIAHGRPEDYFARLAARSDELPRVDIELNPWGVGCYTSMARIKRTHARLEALLYSTEKMAASAALQQLLAYPRAELRQATEDLLFAEFHDTVAGSSVREVEAQAGQRLAHGIDVLERLRARVFFALLSGQPVAASGEFPVFVHNPHPFEVDETVVCELQPPEPNQDRTLFLMPELVDAHGRAVPLQLEKESCNIQADQRKRLVFRAHLPASQTARFACRIRAVPRPVGTGAAVPVSANLAITTPAYEATVNAATGLLDRYRVHGRDFLLPGACQALVVADSADPWGMKVRAFREVVGSFTLMTPRAAAQFAGVSACELAPVRVIESGPVRRVVEALFEHGRSTLCLRYCFPTHGREVGIEARVYWMEKDRMLKLSFPTSLVAGEVLGQAAYGVEHHARRAEELVTHRWLAVTSPGEDAALTIVNDATHGFDFFGGEIRLSLLRSPAYAGHPVDDVTPIVRQDRFEPRVDQGEHRFRFWLEAGRVSERLLAVDRASTVHNESVMALCVSPSGAGKRTVPCVTLSDGVVQLGAMKYAEGDGRVILRLFEPTGQARTTTVSIEPLHLRFLVALGGFELKTLAIDTETRAVTEVDLLER